MPLLGEPRGHLSARIVVISEDCCDWYVLFNRIATLSTIEVAATIIISIGIRDFQAIP